MKNIIGLVAIGVGLLGVALPVRGAVINNAAIWTFDGGPQNGSVYTGTQPYVANSLNSTFFNSGSLTAITPTGGSGTTQGGGTGYNGSGKALQFTAKNTGNNTYNVNGSSFTLALKVVAGGSAITSITITYNYLASVGGTGASGIVANSWSFDNGTKVSAASISQSAVAGNWGQMQVTFSGLQLTAGNTYNFVDTLSNYGNGNGSFASFDNISFNVSGPTVVPEPITYALAAFGLIFIGGGVGRYYRGKARMTA